MYVRDQPALVSYVKQALAGAPPPGKDPPGGLSAEEVKPLRVSVVQALSSHSGTPISEQPGLTALRPEVFEAYAAASGDPDVHLARWLRQGAPLGIIHQLEPSGVFPELREESGIPEQ